MKRTKFVYSADLPQAFDTVNRKALWKVPEKLKIPDKILNVIIFRKGMKAVVVSDREYFDVTNGAKQGCVMASVLLSLFFSVMLKFAFSDMDTIVKFQFRTSGGLCNVQWFQVETYIRICVIRGLLFADRQRYKYNCEASPLFM